MMMNNYHSVVSNNLTLSARLEQGTNSDLWVKVDSKGRPWLCKAEKEGKEAFLHIEWLNLCRLQDTGLVPAVGRKVDPNKYGFLSILCVESAVPVSEYVSAFLDGLIPFEVVEAVLSEVSRVVSEFHSLGWIHNDLHPNNVLIDYCDGWKAYIIDLSWATKGGVIPRDLKRLNLRQSAAQEMDILGYSLKMSKRKEYSEVLDAQLGALINTLFPASDWDGQ